MDTFSKENIVGDRQVGPLAFLVYGTAYLSPATWTNVLARFGYRVWLAAAYSSCFNFKQSWQCLQHMLHELCTVHPLSSRNSQSQAWEKEKMSDCSVPSALLILCTFGDSQLSLGTKDSFAGLKTAD